MIHPDSELRRINDTIGWGVVATRPIPKGTITWVRDEIDQLIPRPKMRALPEPLRAPLDKYSYLEATGNYILCWDNARFVNHSCEASCLPGGFIDFEIAVRDIAPGEQLTDDYGTLNLEAPFDCACGSPRCRKRILKDDILRYEKEWNGLIAAAFPAIRRLPQPLWELVSSKDGVERVLAGSMALPSIVVNYLKP